MTAHVDPTPEPSDPSTQPHAEVPAWADLPDLVRGRIVDWAARALGGLPPAQVPPALVKVSRFTPAKRAKLGATVLGQVVSDDPAFRAVVADLARRETEAAGPADDVGAAAGAYLLHLPENAELLGRVAESGQLDALHARVAELERSLMRYRSRVDALSAERDAARRELAEAAPRAEGELEKLRGRLREQGTRLRAAQQEAAQSVAESAGTVAALQAELARAQRVALESQAKAAEAAERADRIAKSLAAHRDSAGHERSAADRRLDLLLSTVEGAMSGLRREMALGSGGMTPADLVAGQLPAAAASTRSRAADPARLTEWLMLPAAHLVVDGYNVTKTGYGELSLADQRDRLIRGLASLSARTSAEITVVFDGAAVTTAQPTGRGIRVLFSPPGVIADDVIRRLVAAEPAGRVVIVASSDREVVAGVVRDGARTVASDVLIDLLGRPPRPS